jgi:hypothetical protein
VNSLTNFLRVADEVLSKMSAGKNVDGRGGSPGSRIDIEAEDFS